MSLFAEMSYNVLTKQRMKKTITMLKDTLQNASSDTRTHTLKVIHDLRKRHVCTLCLSPLLRLIR